MNTDLYALVHKKVIENDYKINDFVRVKSKHEGISGWIFLLLDRHFQDLKDEDFEPMKLSELLLENPSIRPYLDYPVDSEFYWNEEEEEYLPVKKRGVVDNLIDEFEARLSGYSSLEESLNRERGIASNPGKLRVSMLNFLRYYLFGFPLHLKIYAGVCLFVVVFYQITGLIPVTILYSFFLYYQIAHYNQYFILGNICPSIVISIKPLVIAVYTDLSKMGGGYPVLKVTTIIDNKKSRIKKVGDIIPTIACYCASGNNIHWLDFDPIPAYYASSNTEELQRVRETISEEDLEKLKRFCSEYLSDFDPEAFIDGDLIEIKNEDSNWED